MIHGIATVRDRVDILSTLEDFETMVNNKVSELNSQSSIVTEIKYQVLASPHSDLHTIIAFIHY